MYLDVSGQRRAPAPVRWTGLLGCISVSIIVVETIARDGLTATARARLQIAADSVNYSARNTAIIALGVRQIFFSSAKRNALIYLATDRKLTWLNFRSFVTMPACFRFTPGHNITCPTIQVRDGGVADVLCTAWFGRSSIPSYLLICLISPASANKYAAILPTPTVNIP